MCSVNKVKTEQEAKVILGFNCNNNCFFCYERHKRHLPPKNTEEVIKEIAAARKKGFDKISFIGGEPTLRPDILDLINYAKSLKFSQIMITTNGRMFAYPDFARKITQAGLTQVVFSLHGPNKKIHDQITSAPGSFGQLVEGVKNAKKCTGLSVGTNTTIVNRNYKYLPEITGLLRKWGIKRAEFIWVYPSLLAQYKKIVPMVSKVYPFCKKILNTGLHKNYRWRILNPPLGCYFGSAFSNIGYAGNNEKASFVKTKKSRAYNYFEKEKFIEWKKVKKCLSCRLNSACLGIQRIYLDTFGCKELDVAPDWSIKPRR